MDYEIIPLAPHAKNLAGLVFGRLTAIATMADVSELKGCLGS